MSPGNHLAGTFARLYVRSWSHQNKTSDQAQDAIKLALPELCHLVEWLGLPTCLEWALALDRRALVYQTVSLAARMDFWRLRGPWVQKLKSSSFLRDALMNLEGVV